VKIAYLSNRFPSPVEPYVVDEIGALRKRGIDVLACSILRPAAPDFCELDDSGDGVVYLRPLSLARSILATWLCIRHFWKLRVFWKRVVSGNEPLNRRVRSVAHTWLGAYLAATLLDRRLEHIHVHHGYYGSWVAMVVARLLGIPFSVTLHGSDLLLHGAYLDLKLANCAFCITISEFNRNYIISRYLAIAPEKILVRRVGVDCDRHGLDRAPVGEINSNLNLLSVGRLNPVKDHAFLIRACRRLKDHGIKFKCAIAGDGPERKSLQRLIHELNLAAEVGLLGHVPHRDLDAHYRQADLVVLTSQSEGIPLVLMEAMARGKPVLAPAITGIPELVADGRNGFLYRAGSLENFVDRVEMIRDTYSALMPLREAGRRHVLEHFDRPKNLAAFCNEFLARIGYSEEQPCEDSVLQQI
jgi:colanic acid/amylovoran biosynthesis glycosyltransferase